MTHGQVKFNRYDTIWYDMTIFEWVTQAYLVVWMNPAFVSMNDTSIRQEHKRITHSHVISMKYTIIWMNRSIQSDSYGWMSLLYECIAHHRVIERDESHIYMQFYGWMTKLYKAVGHVLEWDSWSHIHIYVYVNIYWCISENMWMLNDEIRHESERQNWWHISMIQWATY